jgi:phosphate transport system substrate-binding protein
MNSQTCRRGLAAFGVVGVMAASPAWADTLLIQGSTTFNSRLMVPDQGAIEAASRQKLSLVPNKSSLGLMALLEGRADLAMISTSLESEVALLRKAHPELPFERLRSFNIAATRIAFAVHPSNPVRSTDAETLRRVLRGEIGNWRQLGGRDLPIRVVVVRDGGGVQLSVESELLHGRRITPMHPIPMQIGTQVVKVVQQEPGALGLAQLGVLRQFELPELTTDKVVEQQLNFVTLGEPGPNVTAVIAATRRVSLAKLN